MEGKTFAPYKLTIIVHRAENLPVADITTSDPYVTVSHGEKTIGRTKTVYKNHKTPEWDELFNMKLLHTKASIVFNVFDEDKGKNDDLLGTVTVDLSKIALCSATQHAFDVINVPPYKSKSKLFLTISLGRNDQVIKIIPDALAEKELYDIKNNTEMFTKNDVDAIKQELAIIETSVCVQNALYRFVAGGRTEYLTQGLLRDLLYDIQTLTKSHTNFEGIFHSLQYDDNLHRLFKRNKLRLVNSTEITLANSKHQCLRHSPIQMNTLQLNLLADHTNYVILSLPNRYSMWSWVRWLRVCYTIWTKYGKNVVTYNPADDPSLPRWAVNGTHTSSISLNITQSNGVSSSGKCTISFKYPFVLRVDNELISIKPFVSMIISQDSSIPKAYICEIECLSYETINTNNDEIVMNKNRFLSDAEEDLAKVTILDEGEEGGAGVDDAGDDNASVAESTTNSVGASTQCGTTSASQVDVKKKSGHNVFKSFGKGAVNIVKGAAKGTAKGIYTVGNTTTNVASAVVFGAKDVAVDTVMGVTNATVHTVKVVASGNPVNMKAAVTDAAIHLSKDVRGIATHITNVPQNIFGKTNTYVVIKTSSAMQKITKDAMLMVSRNNRDSFSGGQNSSIMYSADSLCSHYIDLNEENLQPKSSRVIENNLESSRYNMRRVISDKDDQSNLVEFTHFPVSDSSNSTVDILLYQGIEGSESLIAAKNIPIRRLLSGNGSGESKTTERKSAHSRQPSSAPFIGLNIGGISSEPSDLELELDATLGLSVTICSGKNLIIPPPPFQNAPVSGIFGSLYAKVKLVDGNGHSGNLGGAEHKTPSIVPNANPDFKERHFIMKADDPSYITCEYVRIELFIEYLTSNTSIGAVFIPLKYFRTKTTEYSFPVVKYRQSNSLLTGASTLVPSLNNVGLGELTVKVNRISEDSNSKCKIRVRTSLKENNIFSSLWYGECLLSGALENDVIDKYMEKFIVSASYDGLVLIENNGNASGHSGYNDKRRNSGCESPKRARQVSHESVSSPSPTDKKKNVSFGAEETRVSESKTPLFEMEIEVFQNQRRQFMYPFDWASKAITRPDYSDLSYAVAYKFDTLADAVPPEGFEWIGDWTLDKTYTKCDDNGWSYAISFGKLLYNYKHNCSHNKPLNTHARRRRWVRTARMKSERAAREAATHRDTIYSGPGSRKRSDSNASECSTDAWNCPCVEVAFCVHSFAKGNDAKYTPPVGATAENTTTKGRESLVGLKVDTSGNLIGGLNSPLSTGSDATGASTKSLERAAALTGADKIGTWRRELYYAKNDSSSNPINSSNAMNIGKAVGGHHSANNNVNKVIALCQERKDQHEPVIVAWSNIYSATIVTPSVLSLHFTVNRYFGELNYNSALPSSQQGKTIPHFKKVEIECFITNCPAFELKSLVDERIWFYRYRTDIKHLILNDLENTAQNTSGNNRNNKARAGSISGDDSNNINEDGGFSPESTNGDTSHPLFSLGHAMSMAVEDDENIGEIPETEELSIGSEIIADLDDTSLSLEHQLGVLDELYANTRDSTVLTEKAVIIRRDCRLRLYMAALLGVGLSSTHSYEINDVHKLMENDFRRMEAIRQDNEVSTANNRIEYLLDTAEKRIRDTALCGWKYKNGKLEKCLEVLTNGYFIEIVGLLGTFFDGAGQSNVKGLHSKVELITTYMKHNDRLDDIIESALRPYALIASPSPKLSIFLDFNILLQWYTSVLLFEMRSRVDDVMSVWKDITKDVSGNTALYKFPLPWIPQRYHSDTGIFYTVIPEDLVEILMTYLSFARLHKENVASSFHASIGKLDNTVCLSFTSAFLYLSEYYMSALSSAPINSNSTNSHHSMFAKDYLNCKSEDEVVEYSTYICSVANDARRVITVDILSAVNKKTKKNDSPKKRGSNNKSVAFDDTDMETQNKLERLVEQTYKSYDKVMYKSLDHLSCILFFYLFHGSENLLDCSFHNIWKACVLQNANNNATSNNDLHNNNNNSNANDSSVPQIVIKLMSDLSEYIQEKSDFLDPYCYSKLIHMCLDKVIVFYLTFLREARNGGQIFSVNSAYVRQMNDDIIAMKRCFIDTICTNEVKQFISESEMTEKFQILVDCHVLLSTELNSVESDRTMESLIALAVAHPKRANSIAFCIEVCMGLRGLKKYVVKSTTPEAAAPARRASMTPSSAASTAAAAAAVAAAAMTGGANKSPTKASHFTFDTAAAFTQSPPPASAAPAARRGSLFNPMNLFSHNAATSAAQPPKAPEPRPMPTMSFDHDSEKTSGKDGGDSDDENDDDDDEEEEDPMIAEMKAQKENFWTLYVEEKINEIHSLCGSANKDGRAYEKYTEVLTKIPPVCRVFDPRSECSKYSLKGQLLQSAMAPSKRELLIEIRQKNGGSQLNVNVATQYLTNNILTNAIGSMFNSNSSNTKNTAFSSSTKAGDNSTNGSGNTAPTAGGNHYTHMRRISLSNNSLPELNNKRTLLLQMLITRLQINNLFYLDILNLAAATLHPYIIIKLGDYSYKTMVKTDNSDTNPNWSNECPIELPLYDSTVNYTDNQETANSKSSMNELLISLYYQGYFQDQFISQILVPFTNFSPPVFDDKQFVFSDFTKSPRAASAAAKATAERRGLPTLTMSISQLG